MDLQKLLKNNYYRELFSLFLLGTAGLLLIVLRIIFTGAYWYIFLVWNAFLAIVPLGFAYWYSHISYDERLKKTGVFLAWLFFFPNTFYIITDLVHLEFIPGVFWFDLLTILFFALLGILAGIFSMKYVFKDMLNKGFSFKNEILFLIVSLLGGIGIYLGRFPRWNSWDILYNSHKIVGDVMQAIGSIYFYEFMLGFGGFIYVTFLAYRILLPPTK